MAREMDFTVKGIRIYLRMKDLPADVFSWIAAGLLGLRMETESLGASCFLGLFIQCREYLDES